MKSLIIVAQNFQDEEYIYPYYRLQDFSEVVVASSDGEIKTGKYGVPAKATIKFKDVNFNEIDIVVIPGGFECPDRLRIDEDCLKLVKKCAGNGSIIAAICHGPWVLISAKLTDGKKMTSYKAVHIDLENSGAKVYSEQNVVVDGNFVTAQHYKDNPEFMRAVETLAKNRIRE